ncbi:hypothetical protein HK103_007386 [Boothiomyces macroporosus]|uniref:Uncharacterized protein n=1 Tax=Boothiomyces macroporosus TaxID=261099 RepID=A0AAD5ULI0_9FUNG|nr:hypothetical protein HK103_007386 [Boothiomyces macroporosus]
MVILKDYPNAIEKRLAARPAHLERNAKAKETGFSLLGGAILNNEQQMIGSAVLFDAPSKEALEEYIKEDPYVKQKVWEKWEIYPFKIAGVSKYLNYDTSKSSSNQEINQGQLSLDDFNLLEVIGKGAFGKVRTVEHNTNKRRYALKYVDKAQCISQYSTRNIIRERIILQNLRHPFIMKLCYAFQDKDIIYFVLELASGDLSFHLTKVGMFPDSTAMIYAAELISGIKFMHSKYILHRDLKPENVLIDQEGHLKITDFNVSVNMKEKSPKSKAGTIYFMAPEMMTGKSYSYSIDWWAFGMIMYMCTYGENPFLGLSDEKVYEAIKTKEINYPLKFRIQGAKCEISEDRKSFIQGCLNRNINERLGYSKDVDIKQHKYLSGIDWELLEAKKLAPQYIPKKGTNHDTAIMAIEELLGGDSLADKVKKEKKKKDKEKDKSKSIGSLFGGVFSKFTHGSTASIAPTKKNRKQIEMNYINQYFLPYDYEEPEKNIMVMPPPIPYESEKDLEVKTGDLKNTKGFAKSTSNLKLPDNEKHPSRNSTSRVKEVKYEITSKPDGVNVPKKDFLNVKIKKAFTSSPALSAIASAPKGSLIECEEEAEVTPPPTKLETKV